MEELNLLQEEIDASWSTDFPQEPLADLKNHLLLMNDIAGELYEVRSPSQLEELSEDARNASEELVGAINEMKEILDMTAAEVNESILASTNAVLIGNRKTVENGEVLKGLMAQIDRKSVV